jgi:YVTN family beta-propeller protein
MIRQVVFILMLSVDLGTLSAGKGSDFQNATPPSPRPPADIPFTRLKADAVLPLALGPESVESADAVWIPNRAAGTVVRVEPKDNTLGSAITVGAQPCASLVVAFDSVWVPLCGDGTLARVDTKAPKVTATLKTAVASSDGRIATAVGSIWAITDRKGVLSRIDPDTNLPVAEIYVAGGASAIASGGDALWITSEDGSPSTALGEGPSTSPKAGPSTSLRAGRLTRVNPHNNEIVEVVEVGPRPGRLAVGEGGVWTLNRGNGTVTRVDPKTNKVVATISIGDGAAEGEVAAGLGSVWISAAGVPIIRIDPKTNRAVQRFTGEGGGAILVAHGSLWVAAGPQITWRLDPLLVSSMRP